jgi:hypothetical protein
MSRAFYRFSSFDQNDFNWLTRVADRDRDGYGVRFSFLSAFCTGCGKFDQDAVFKIGFENAFVRIRVRKGRNILRTDDGFLCLSGEILKALTKAGVKGFESKPLSTDTDWHVVRITDRRPFDLKVYQTAERTCLKCGRPEWCGGLIQSEREIELPKERFTFFSTDKERGTGGYDVFVTDGLCELLRESGAKGGELYKLWTLDEERRLREDPKWRRKDGGYTLGQHRYGPTN